MKTFDKATLLLGTLLSTVALSATSAAAQTVVGDPDQAQIDRAADAFQDEIVVTGSRIQRTQDFIANSPVATVESVQFDRTGSINTEQLLNILPQTVPGLGRTSNNPGNGTATVDLRGLGSNRTLVLVNGRRAQPSGVDGVVDINTIPPALIENVEVLTGGASSVYGADAVSGVVNFILKDDFEGVEANVGGQITTGDGDAETATISVTAGGNFADGRGNAVVSAGYTYRSALFQGARDFSTFAQFDDGAGNLFNGGSSGIPETAIRNGLGASSSCAVQLASPTDTCPEGQLTVTNGPLSSAVFLPNGDAREFISGGDNNDFYNFAPVNYLQLPQDRYTVYGKADYEISDAFEVFVEGRFVQNEIPQQLAATPIFTNRSLVDFSLDNNPFLTRDTQIALSGNNTDFVGLGGRQARQLQDPDLPFSPFATPAMGDMAAVAQNLCTNCVFDSDGDGFADVAPLVDTDGDGVADLATDVFLRRRLLEVGPRIGSDTRNTFQAVIGARGDISDNVGYEVFYSEGRTNNSSFQEGNVNRDRFAQALVLASDGNGNVDTSNVRCADPGNNGSTSACAPLNIFGQGNISPDAAQFIRTAVTSTDETLQRVLQGNITGELGEGLRFGDRSIGFAIGAEYIENAFEFRPSQDLAAGTIAGFNGAPAVEGDFNVYSAYGELLIPLLQDVNFIDDLNLELAGRVSDFSTVGTEYNWRVGGDWTVSDLIRFRGAYNTAVRAPNIGELFSPQGENFPGAADPCSSSGAGDGITEAVRQLCIATGVPAGLVGSEAIDPASGQVRSLTGGNPNLDAEKADTYTIGVVLAPNFFDDFTLAVDYFDITIDDAVSSLAGGTSGILQQCYNGAAGGVGSVFCDAVNRGPDGSILFVETLSQNVARETLNGVDIAANASFDTGNFAGGFFGDLYVSYNGTYTIEDEFTAFEGDEPTDCVGTFGNFCGEPQPDYTHFVTTGFDLGSIFEGTNVNVQGTWQYIGSVDDDGTTGQTFAVTEIGDRSYFNLSGTVDFSDKVALTLGLNNVLDDEPPIIGDNQEQANTYPSTYDVFGRTLFGNIRARF